jgi:hypothetical protein
MKSFILLVIVFVIGLGLGWYMLPSYMLGFWLIPSWCGGVVDNPLNSYLRCTTDAYTIELDRCLQKHPNVPKNIYLPATSSFDTWMYDVEATLNVTKCEDRNYQNSICNDTSGCNMIFDGKFVPASIPAHPPK